MTIQTRIIGTGSYLPPLAIGNEEVSRGLSLGSEAVYRLTGIRVRHRALTDQASSDLAFEAAKQACEAADVRPQTLDAVVVSTTSADMPFPSTACLLQGRLGIPRAAAFDLSASCSGFLYALATADRLIRSGQYRRCLVVAAEIKSRFLDPADEQTAILFADGAGAAVVEGHPAEAGGRGLLGLRLFADGAQRGLIGIPAGGSRRPATRGTVQFGEHVLRMQGAPLFRLAVKRLASAVTDLLKEFTVELGEIDVAIFHQANGRLLAALARRLQLAPHKLYTVIEDVGNASSASLPIALDRANREGRLRPGHLVLLGAFGGGLTWGAGLMRW